MRITFRMTMACATLLMAGCQGAGGAQPVGAPSAGVAEGGSLFGDLPPALMTSVQPAALPTGKLGRAAFIYDTEDNATRGHSVVLVMGNGRMYMIAQDAAVGVGPDNVTLSPDGRWLGLERTGGWVLRDLTGTGEVRIADGNVPSVWSDDAAHLLVERRDADQVSYGIVNLPDGDLHVVAQHGTNLDSVALLLDDHRAVVADRQTMVQSAGFSVAIADLATQDRKRLVVDVAASLRPGETTRVAFATSKWWAGGSPPTIWLAVGQAGLVPSSSPEVNALPIVALIGIDPETGSVTGRTELGSPKKGDATICAGVVAGGALLVHYTSDTTELVRTDRRGATRHPVTRLPGIVKVHGAGTTF